VCLSKELLTCESHFGPGLRRDGPLAGHHLWLLLEFLEHLGGHRADHAPVLGDVSRRRVLRRHCEANHVPAAQRRRHAVKLSARVELLQQLLGQLVLAAQTEAHHAQVARGGHLEPRVAAHQRLKLLRQAHTLKSEINFRQNHDLKQIKFRLQVSIFHALIIFLK
jgi:hypothetical protein